MSTIFVRHPVADFNAWRGHYDADADRRDQAGLQEVGVFQNSSDPNDVLIVFTADGRAGMDAMLDDPGLKETMEAAGVLGPPRVFVAE
jgi:hypothetical protein